jgi:hypothetical protein
MVPLADLNDLVFGAWDIFLIQPEAGDAAGVLEKDLLNKVKNRFRRSSQ